MLRAVKTEELHALAEAFWPLTQDLTRSTYPTYTDGIKTRHDFVHQLCRAADGDWGEVLLHLRSGQINGLLLIDQVDEQHVSLQVCLTRACQHECLRETLAYISGKHPGKTLWIGFAPENRELLDFVTQQGFELQDSSINWTLHLATWPEQEVPTCVHRVTEENYGQFRSLWTDQEMYWTAERIREHLDRWRLFVYRDGERPCGAAACMDEGLMLEIFGFQYAAGYDQTVHQALMTACLCDAKGRAQHLTYFSSEEEAPVMKALGFQRVSDYLCYEKRL